MEKIRYFKVILSILIIFSFLNITYPDNKTNSDKKIDEHSDSVNFTLANLNSIYAKRVIAYNAFYDLQDKELYYSGIEIPTVFSKDFEVVYISGFSINIIVSNANVIKEVNYTNINPLVHNNSKYYANSGSKSKYLQKKVTIDTKPKKVDHTAEYALTGATAALIGLAAYHVFLK